MDISSTGIGRDKDSCIVNRIVHVTGSFVTSIARLSICSNTAGVLYNLAFLVSGGNTAGLIEWSYNACPSSSLSCIKRNYVKVTFFKHVFINSFIGPENHYNDIH